MATTELTGQDMDKKAAIMARQEEQARRAARMASPTRASSDFYGGVGWLIGLLVTLFISAPAIWLLSRAATGSTREQIIIIGIGLAWWLNPLSLGALGYLVSNIRTWRFRVLAGLLVWFVVNVLVSLAIISDPARGAITVGLIYLFYFILFLLFLYIQLRVFVWAASGKPARFFFGILAWGALNGLIYAAFINQEILNILLTVLGFVFQIVFAISFVVIQFVAIFWFMAQSRVEVIRPGDPKQLTFDDYKGQANLIKLVRQWIYLMSDRGKFQKMGGQFINGLLLYGEPGTGKTMLAKCMAGEAGIAFISIEGSGFRAMFMGVDVLKMIRFISRARKLAREYGACIAYIDEIDAVGMSRGSVMGGQGQTGMGMGMGGMFGGGTGALTRLLYEMDGISELTRWEKWRARWHQLRKKPVPPRDWHVLFMGSTNRPDVLDPALTRPGRFDRTIVVDKPDRAGRREILKYYLGKIKHDESVDVEALVSDTAWATPAKIMSAVTKDAVRLALFDDRERVAQHDIELAFQEQAMGLENPIEEMEEDQRQQVAYHEAGHAIVQYYLRPDERIVRVSIIRRSEALGYVLPVPNYDIYSLPLKTLVADILVSMAGHVAVKVFLGEYWTGAASDFQNIRARLWTLANHGYFGPPVVMDMPTMMGARTFEGRASLVEKFWQQLEEQTEYILKVHTPEVHAVADSLLKKGDLTGKECIEIIRAAAAPVNREAEGARVLEPLLTGTMAETQGNNGDQPTVIATPKKYKPRAKVETEEQDPPPAE
jgi:cell division protease FtsH